MMSFLSVGLLLTLVTSSVLAEDINNIISQAENQAAAMSGAASKLIDVIRDNAARDTALAVDIVDQTSKENKPNEIGWPFPKQEKVKAVPVPNEGKGRCRQSTASQGKCASSFLQGLDQRPLAEAHPNTQLLIFVSSSMPQSSIKELYTQAHKVGGKLLFRGLIGGSFKETQSYIQELKVIADIDPTKFEEFRVEHVPTIILNKGDKSDRMVGNVSVNEFLEQAIQYGDLKLEASFIFKKLQGEKS